MKTLQPDRKTNSKTKCLLIKRNSSSSDRCGFCVERTYWVSSSVSCVWSGGKNFTTKRRMVFLGPERGREERTWLKRKRRKEKARDALRKMKWCNGWNELERYLRLICFNVGFSRSSHTWERKEREHEHHCLKALTKTVKMTAVLLLSAAVLDS